MSGRLKKIAVRPAAEVCALFERSEPAQALSADGLSCEQYLTHLQEHGLQIDAVRLLAHALPKVDAVWWGWRCAGAIAGASPTAPATASLESAALEAARRWCGEPSEANRRAAEQAANLAGLGTPAGCVAFAVFVAEGSLAPPDVASPVPPPDHLTGQCIAGAVLLAGVVTEPELSAQKYAQFLDLGFAIGADEDGPPRDGRA